MAMQAYYTMVSVQLVRVEERNGRVKDPRNFTCQRCKDLHCCDFLKDRVTYLLKIRYNKFRIHHSPFTY